MENMNKIVEDILLDTYNDTKNFGNLNNVITRFMVSIVTINTLMINSMNGKDVVMGAIYDDGEQDNILTFMTSLGIRLETAGIDESVIDANVIVPQSKILKSDLVPDDVRLLTVTDDVTDDYLTKLIMIINIYGSSVMLRVKSLEGFNNG